MVDLLCPKQRSLYPINYDFTKLRASTGNRTRNNSLEGCYANHYTIDALGDLLIFEARNYIFKSNMKIQKELASSGNRTRAARVAGEHSTTEQTMLIYVGLFVLYIEDQDHGVIVGLVK